jgi:hypothetical protein
MIGVHVYRRGRRGRGRRWIGRLGRAARRKRRTVGALWVAGVELIEEFATAASEFGTELPGSLGSRVPTPLDKVLCSRALASPIKEAVDEVLVVL